MSQTRADPRGGARRRAIRSVRFEPQLYTLYTYGAVQAWAQAAEKAGLLELEAMIASLRQHQFDTVLRPIDFDDKGDRAVQDPAWYVWRGGTHVPLE
jgi:branched-chain amino acid transport system substrate-binding protein